MNTNTTPRDMRLDAVRGLFLVIMAGVHIPSPVSHWLNEPFGFTSAAEGFIFLSACLAGLVYGKVYGKGGWPEMSRRVWNRAKVVYIVHLAVLLPVALIAWADFKQIIPLANHFHDFLVHPLASLLLIPLLLHQPPLFDILPLYVVLLLATPLVFTAARRQGWKTVMAVSFCGWLAAQWQPSYLPVDSSNLLPVRWGSFNLLAWQFLWIAGLALGETSLRGRMIPPSSRAVWGGLAAIIVMIGFCGRHEIIPGLWNNPAWDCWMDKWSLGPLRLINFSAWVVLLLAWNPRPPDWLLAPTALWGRHSLAVFALHLPLVVTATSVIQMFALTDAEQTVIVLSVIASIWLWVSWLESNAQQRKRIAAFPVTAIASTPWRKRLQYQEIIPTVPINPSAG